MIDFYIESTGEENIFIALSYGAVKWARALEGPFRQFFDSQTDAFVFPLPANKSESEGFRDRVKEAGLKIRE